MRFTIKKNALLAQLPKEIEYTLLSGLDDLPETFVFDGIPEESNREDEIWALYPKVMKCLTAIERSFFFELEGKVNGVRVFSFFKYTSSEALESYQRRNAVSVHVSHMRKKFKKYKLPFQIKITKGNSYQESRYTLIYL